MMMAHLSRKPSEKAELLLAAARYLNETLEPERVHDRFHELLETAVPHGGVVVSAFDPETELITCEYAWVDGEKLDPSIFPALPLNREGGGMQSRVITTGEPLLVNDVPEQVKEPGGVYYDVDREGQMRKVPEEGRPGVQAAMMMPVKHEGQVVGVVQLMNADAEYDAEQLELAEGLIGLMGAAARNARLHQTAQAEAAARARAEATAAERENAARVLDAVGDGVFLLDDDGLIRFWNRAAELVTRKAGDSVWGRPAAEIFGEWERLKEQIPVSESSAPARPVTLPVDIDGRELWLSFVAVRGATGCVYAFRDFTVERRLDEAKSEFVATVSHELRTPMTAVLGAAKTLMRDDIELTPERRRQLLEMIGAQGTRLTKIAEDVLIASRLDRDELRLERDHVDIAELARTAVEHMREYAPETISLTARTESDGAALGDRHRIEQVLVNLIDNAIKYSPEGGEVSVSTAASGEGVRVEVRDQGIGIPPAEQTSIFEKFYRGSLEGEQVRAGTGLGLYICRELVRRMGGTIGVESDVGSGSTFYFELPRAA
jgi:signal transduction histidine kinase